jgi:hypothetical protein
MDDELTRFWTNLVGRLSGPMSFRLILQPLVATAFAIRAGLQDARAGRPLYTKTVLTHPTHHLDMLREGWRTVVKVFVLAALLDMVYQWMVFRWVYPMEAFFVAFLLACVPYLLIRGPANRIGRAWYHRRNPTEARRP